MVFVFCIAHFLLGILSAEFGWGNANHFFECSQEIAHVVKAGAFCNFLNWTLTVGKLMAGVRNPAKHHIFLQTIPGQLLENMRQIIAAYVMLSCQFVQV